MHDDRYEWGPFGDSDLFSAQWWARAPYLEDNPWFVQALIGHDEVVRVELDREVHIDHFAGTPEVGDTAVEIVLIEVAATHRGRGIGTDTVRALIALHPAWRFLAFSEEADHFWASLGWERFMHATDPDHYRPLFIQPIT